MRTRDENKEAAIREKAIEMIVKYGMEGFGVNKLAKAAGVSPATLYIYFKDKEDLIVQIGLYVSNKLFTYSLRNFSADMSFAEGLKVQWENRFEYFTKHPLEMEFFEIIRYTNIYEKVLSLQNHTLGNMMSDFMNNAIKRKELAKLPFEVYWSVAFGPLYQLIKFHTQGQSYANQDFALNNKILNQALGLVLKALKP